MSTNEQTPTTSTTSTPDLEHLPASAKLREVLERANAILDRMHALEARVAALESTPAVASVRDRGPTSTREMTEEDARRIMLGDLKGAAHRKAAEVLGLSYGQVYSARGGYTFKGVYAEAKAAEKA